MQAPRRVPGRGSHSADGERVSGSSTDLGSETFIEFNLLFGDGCIMRMVGCCCIKSRLGQQATVSVTHWPTNYRLWHEPLANALVLYIGDCLAFATVTQGLSEEQTGAKYADRKTNYQASVIQLHRAHVLS
jgi:hypothetical protein